MTMASQRLYHFFSRYRPRYIRALVYMLQASEYHIRDYLKWYYRTRDFSHVEYRKRLVKTPKAIVLLVLGWVMVAVLVALDVGLLRMGIGPEKYAIALLIFFLAPFIIAFAILAPVICLKIVQRSVEYFLLRQTRRRLINHKAVKIAIAGSFGKTTMREILKTVLSEGKKAAAPPHSWNTPLGIRRFVRTLTGDEDVLIFELGEYYPGDVRKLCRLVQPDIGVITGVNEAHLEKFKSLEQTARTIYELADYLGAKPVYVNGESGRARDNARSGHIVYSRESAGEWKIGDTKTGLAGTSFTLTKGSAKLELASGLLGLHQIGPLAAACDIALRLGLSPAEVRSGIGRTRPFEHRLEPKTDHTGVVTIDDSYNGNPDGVRAGVEFLASLRDRRRWYVTPGLVEMGARTREVHREIGRNLAQAGIEKVVLIRNSVTSFIEEGLKEGKYGGDIIWFDDALAVYAALPHMTAKGDVVLLQNDWPDQYQ